MPHWFEVFLFLLACVVALLFIAIAASVLLVLYGIRCAVQTVRRRRAARFGAHTDVALAVLTDDRLVDEVIAEYEREFLPEYRQPPSAMTDSYVSPEDFRWTN